MEGDDLCTAEDAGADGDADADADGDADADVDADVDGDTDADGDADCSGGPTAWTIELLDEQHVFRPSLAMDSRGDLHLAYGSLDTAKMRHATNASGAWVAEDVDERPSFGNSVLAMHDDIPCVAYSLIPEANAAVVSYARREADGWHSEPVDTVDTYSDESLELDLAIDTHGNAHVVHVQNDEVQPLASRVRYATNASGEWVAIDLIAGHLPSVVVDGEGHVHIVAHAWAVGLVYFTDAGGVLEQETVSGHCYDPKLAIQEDGDLRLACAPGGTRELQFWTNDGAGWDLDDTWGGDGGFLQDLVAVPDGSLRMPFTERLADSWESWDGALLYASGMPGAFGVEAVRQVPRRHVHEDANVGSASMTRSAAGHVHIVYTTIRDRMFHAERCE